jgi:elongator complex protein 4
MSFRKRNVVLSQAGSDIPASTKTLSQSLPGVKPSPVTGSQTTSTGTASLDKLLGLGAGLALGSSVLIEEEGTTDFASSLLKCFAAEGMVQGHSVFVVSPEGSFVLPEVVEDSSSKSKDPGGNGGDKERMKIAWRYERLGDFTARTGGAFYAPCRLTYISKIYMFLQLIQTSIYNT